MPVRFPMVSTQGILLASKVLGRSYDISITDDGGGPQPHTGPNDIGGGPQPHTGPNDIGGGPQPHTGPNDIGGGPQPHTGPNDIRGGGPQPHTGPNDIRGGGPQPHTGPNDGKGANREGGCTCSNPSHTAPGDNPVTTRPGPGFPFRIENQQEPHWCWAAVASGIDRYYSGRSGLSQCQVASDYLEEDACPFPDDYDAAESLEDVLADMNRLSATVGRPSFDALRDELDANRPVAAFIRWDEEHGHFVAICGYTLWSKGLVTIDVADPFYPDSTQDFATFPTTYHGGGTWEKTYFTD